VYFAKDQIPVPKEGGALELKKYPREGFHQSLIYTYAETAQASNSTAAAAPCSAIHAEGRVYQSCCCKLSPPPPSTGYVKPTASLRRLRVAGGGRTFPGTLILVLGNVNLCTTKTMVGSYHDGYSQPLPCNVVCNWILKIE